MKSKWWKYLGLLPIYLLVSSSILGQDVMMQGWYWDYPKTAHGANWTDTLTHQVKRLADNGFTHIWLPPMTNTSSGPFSNGYDPRDLYDLGEFGGATGLGTRSQLDQLVDTITSSGMHAVADVVYNHRDGGLPESNAAVEGWIENMTCSKLDGGDQPYPSDRYRLILPIGGNTGHSDGTYYIKVESKTGHPNYYNYGYRFYAHTNRTGYQNLPDLTENEANNDGGGCGQGSDAITLGRNILANLDDVGVCSGACRVDEFALTIPAQQFHASGDTLYIYLNNTGAYSDHYISELYYNGSNIQDQLMYQTYTDFTQLPSGRGGMDHLNFKPNGNPTNLSGDWDYMYFFYDYDQGQQSTFDTLSEWTKWLWEDVGIRGLRMDAIKHFPPEFVGDILDYMHDQGYDMDMVVGEFYDTNPAALQGWINDVLFHMDNDTKAAINPRIFDFALRQALKDASDAFGYDVRNLYTSGMIANGGNPAHVVTFCNNHDYRDFGQAIQNDADLAYAYMLLHGNLGSPCVFYPDYFGTDIPHHPGERLATDIDIMMDVRQQYILNNWNHINLNAIGSFFTQSYASGFPNTTIAMQVKGGGGLSTQDAIIVINYAGETLDMTTTLEGTNISNGDEFVDVSGHSLNQSSMVDGYAIRVVVPARSYAVYVKSPSGICDGRSTVYVDSTASGRETGGSWEDAYRRLPSAVHMASLCPNLDTILIARGTYDVYFESTPEVSLEIPNGLSLIGGFPSGGSAFQLRDKVQYPTRISGAASQAYHVVTYQGLDTARLESVYIQNGNANGSSTADQVAGGLINQGVLVLDDVDVLANTSLSYPSSILNTGPDARLKLVKVTIIDSSTSPDVSNTNGGSILILENSSIKE